jgi:hypothetical protein
MLEKSEGVCERCGRYVIFWSIDYCAVCFKDLCPECMQKGHCGNIPALSGRDADGIEGVDEDGLPLSG